MRPALLRTKGVEQSIRDTEEGEHRLRRELGPVQLVVFGRHSRLARPQPVPAGD